MANQDEKQRAAEKQAREQYENAVAQLREGSHRFTSKVRAQSAIVFDELFDPEGDAVAALADVEGDAGAIALAMPLDIITLETWLLGQIGDQEELDLDMATHRDLWFNFGSFIGEFLRLRHGGHWLIMGDKPQQWRLGFSKVLLEVVPHLFAEQLLRMGAGGVRKLISEVERLRTVHEEQKERDKGQELDRFTPQHYVRMHTMPLGQFLAMDFALLERLWNKAPTRELIVEIRKAGEQLGEGNRPIIDQLSEALSKANQEQPIAPQTKDKGLFEAVAQIVSMRRASAPMAMDVLERLVIPTLHIGIPETFPPIDDEEITALRKGVELFALFVDVLPHKFSATDDGFLRAFPVNQLASPYRDKTNLDIGKGDWVMINPMHLKPMLAEFEPDRLMKKYEEFTVLLQKDSRAPKRRDDGKVLADMVIRCLADIKGTVGTVLKDQLVLVFRILPPPG